jgi:hypothetical protein
MERGLKISNVEIDNLRSTIKRMIHEQRLVPSQRRTEVSVDLYREKVLPNLYQKDKMLK